MDQYFLPKHVFFCGDEAIVFLDLKKDEYSMIQGEQARVFHSLCHGARNDDLRQSAAAAGDVSAVLKELFDAGVLTTDRAKGKPVFPTHAEPPREPLVDPDLEPPVRVGALDVCRFFAACATAAVWLRLRSIDATVAAVQSRKAKRGAQRPIDWEKARHRVAVFNKLRMLFPADYLCLFDSLALIHFLARYDIYPTWVFAVKAHPWEAHCWVQEGPFVFNEGVEEAAGYDPIMTI